jgi:maltodextrin utilization protein YvdJ
MPPASKPTPKQTEAVLGNNQQAIMRERHQGRWFRGLFILIVLIALVVAAYYGYKFALVFMHQSANG